MEPNNQFTPGYITWFTQFISLEPVNLFLAIRRLSKEKLQRLRQSLAPGLLYEKIVGSSRYRDFHTAAKIIDNVLKYEQCRSNILRILSSFPLEETTHRDKYIAWQRKYLYRGVHHTKNVYLVTAWNKALPLIAYEKLALPTYAHFFSNMCKHIESVLILRGLWDKENNRPSKQPRKEGFDKKALPSYRNKYG